MPDRPPGTSDRWHPLEDYTERAALLRHLVEHHHWPTWTPTDVLAGDADLAAYLARQQTREDAISDADLADLHRLLHSDDPADLELALDRLRELVQGPTLDLFPDDDEDEDEDDDE